MSFGIKRIGALVLGGMILLLLSRCDQERQASYEELLSDGPWRQVARMVTPPIVVGNAEAVSDLYNSQETCQKDNIFKFDISGTYTYEESNIVCVGNDQVLYYGDWQIIAENGVKYLEFSTPAPAYRLEIVSLDQNQLKLMERWGSSTNYIETSTFEDIE